MRQRDLKKIKDDGIKPASDTSIEEKEEVQYMDSDGEQPVENENVYSDDERNLEYVQPDMKEWIPVHENKLANHLGKLKSTLVRLSTEVEESSRDCVRNTVLDRLGNLVKTYVGMEPPALQKSVSFSFYFFLVSKAS